MKSGYHPLLIISSLCLIFQRTDWTVYPNVPWNQNQPASDLAESAELRMKEIGAHTVSCEVNGVMAYLITFLYKGQWSVEQAELFFSSLSFNLVAVLYTM